MRSILSSSISIIAAFGVLRCRLTEKTRFSFFLTFIHFIGFLHLSWREFDLIWCWYRVTLRLSLSDTHSLSLSHKPLVSHSLYQYLCVSLFSSFSFPLPLWPFLFHTISLSHPLLSFSLSFYLSIYPSYGKMNWKKMEPILYKNRLKSFSSF